MHFRLWVWVLLLESLRVFFDSFLELIRKLEYLKRLGLFCILLFEVLTGRPLYLEVCS
jgi:hypothetical protein